MSGYHCVDYCQEEPEHCCRNEKTFSTTLALHPTAKYTLSVSLLQLEYTAAQYQKVIKSQNCNCQFLPHILWEAQEARR